jgi:serine protease Do
MSLRTTARAGLTGALCISLAAACGGREAGSGDPQPVEVARETAASPTRLPESGHRLTAVPAPPPGADNLAETVPDVAERSVKGVVNISTTRVMRRREAHTPFESEPFFREFFGGRMPRMPRAQRESSLGSGVLVSKDGLVVTNNHVVEGATDIKVSFADGREFKAELGGTDPKSDLALLRLKGDLKNLEPLPIANSDKLRLGETVLAIGNPFGLGHTVTMGIVSAKGRANLGIVDYENFIQTDAAINPGNSGGALLNLKGELVGINTAILSRSGGYQGIGFAIPSNVVLQIKDELLTHGKVTRGWLGIMIQDLRPELKGALGLGDVTGVLVADVVPDGPAAKAGIQRGDVVVEIEGRPMTETSELRNFVASLGAERRVNAVVVRRGEKKTIPVTLGKLPDEGEAQATELGCDSKGGLGGLEVAPIDAKSRRDLGIPDRIQEGLVVTGVQEGCSAESSGLREGDVIVEVNQEPVSALADLKRTLAKSGDTALLVVVREGHTIFVPVSRER